MAITVTPEITGQEATALFTYCYLYEPLRVAISESDLTATKMYIDIELIDMANSATIKETLLKYAEFDINSGVDIKVDLMKIAKQLHDANVYKYGAKRSWSNPTLNPDDWETWQSTVNKYRFNFKIYTDKTVTPILVKKSAIIGGRTLEQFTPVVDENQALTEFDYYGLNVGGLINPLPVDIHDQSLQYRWGNIYFQTVTLAPANDANGTPSSTTPSTTESFYPKPCAGGYLLWKSRFGSWMWWGFDIQDYSQSSKYDGRLEVGMFEGQENNLGDSVAYVEPDYTGKSMSYTRKLKALSLNNAELQAVQGIEASPAVYYIQEIGANPLGNAELMRVGSVSAPLDTKANGGDFTVTLKSISTQSHQAK